MVYGEWVNLATAIAWHTTFLLFLLEFPLGDQ